MDETAHEGHSWAELERVVARAFWQLDKYSTDSSVAQ